MAESLGQPGGFDPADAFAEADPGGAWCEGEGAARIGLGECVGRVEASG